VGTEEVRWWIEHRAELTKATRGVTRMYGVVDAAVGWAQWFETYGLGWTRKDADDSGYLDDLRKIAELAASAGATSSRVKLLREKAEQLAEFPNMSSPEFKEQRKTLWGYRKDLGAFVAMLDDVEREATDAVVSTVRAG
jgi:plasmid stabilization system protein ParE